MTTKDFIIVFLFLISIALIGFVGGINSSLTNYKIIAECEKELLRNQSCVVVAVIEEAKG